MPVNPAIASAQVQRFKSLPNFPDPAGQIVLRRAFQEACEDDGQVKKVGDWMERTVRFGPVPADVYSAAEAVRLNDENRIPEWTGGYKCATCQDTGWLGYEKDGASFARRCADCTGKVRAVPKAAGGAS